MSKSRKNIADDSSTIEWLANAIGQATKSAKFCVDGVLPVVDPGLVVDGLGAIKFPLKPAVVKTLVACCKPSDLPTTG